MVGKSLIMPACKIIVRKLVRQDAGWKFEKDCDHQRIDDMSQDVVKVLYNKLENKGFTIQVDESTDFTNKCHSVAFVIFVNGDEFYSNFPCAKVV